MQQEEPHHTHTKCPLMPLTMQLLAQQLPPHTFFNFVFLNKNQFEAQKIPEDVILHEETHAKQKHSLDILLIELAQVVFGSTR